MKIEAEVSFYLWEGTSIIGGSCRLEMIIKFNDPTCKFFKKKKIETTISYSNDFPSVEDFYGYVQTRIKDDETLLDNAAYAIKQYFRKKYRKLSEDQLFNDTFDIVIRKKLTTSVEVDTP